MQFDILVGQKLACNGQGVRHGLTLSHRHSGVDGVAGVPWTICLCVGRSAGADATDNQNQQERGNDDNAEHKQFAVLTRHHEIP